MVYIRITSKGVESPLAGLEAEEKLIWNVIVSTRMPCPTSVYDVQFTAITVRECGSLQRCRAKWMHKQIRHCYEFKSVVHQPWWNYAMDTCEHGHLDCIKYAMAPMIAVDVTTI